MRKFSHIFHNRFYDLEIFVCVVGVFYGSWLAAPWWQTFAPSKSYVAMAQLAPEYMWGTLVILLSLSQIILLYRYAFYAEENSKLRSYFSAASTSIWFFIAAMFIASNIATTGVPVYSLFAVAACINTIRLTQHSYGKL